LALFDTPDIDNVAVARLIEEGGYVVAKLFPPLKYSGDGAVWVLPINIGYHAVSVPLPAGTKTVNDVARAIAHGFFEIAPLKNIWVDLHIKTFGKVEPRELDKLFADSKAISALFKAPTIDSIAVARLMKEGSYVVATLFADSDASELTDSDVSRLLGPDAHDGSSRREDGATSPFLLCWRGIASFLAGLFSKRQHTMEE
jgi:hypothetical protein